jgi:D-alanyl-D-alanine carboxypeptidase
VIRAGLLAFALVTAAAADEGEARKASAYKRLDQFVTRHMRENNTPGLVVAITNGERLLAVRSYGFSDLATRTLVTPATVFPIGSISKALTPTALFQLHEAGKVDLNAPPARYLPWLPVNSSYTPFTIHHLLSHTAGLPSDRDDLPSTLYAAFAVHEQAVGFAPGEGFAYSNVGYALLGRVVEAAAGMPLGEFERTTIFEPLGMTAAQGSIANANRSRIAVGYPAYHDDRPFHSSHPVRQEPWVEWESGDGNVAVSSTDMAAFSRMLLNRGAGPRGRILSEASFRVMTQHAVKIRDGLHYGYGITLREKGILAHRGGMVGYTAMLLVDTEEGIGIAVLTNGGVCDPDVVAGFALDLIRAVSQKNALPAEPPSPAVVSNAAEYAVSMLLPAGRDLS